MESSRNTPTYSPDPVLDFVGRQVPDLGAPPVPVLIGALSAALQQKPVSQENFLTCQNLLASGFCRNVNPLGPLEIRLLDGQAMTLPPGALERRMDAALRVLLLRAMVLFRAKGLPLPVVGCFGEHSAVIFSTKNRIGVVVSLPQHTVKADITDAILRRYSPDGVVELSAKIEGAVRELNIPTKDVVTLEGSGGEQF